VILRSVQLCILQNDYNAQESAIKLIYNLLTDDKCCSLVLNVDGIFAIY